MHDILYYLLNNKITFILLWIIGTFFVYLLLIFIYSFIYSFIEELKFFKFLSFYRKIMYSIYINSRILFYESINSMNEKCSYIDKYYTGSIYNNIINRELRYVISFKKIEEEVFPIIYLKINSEIPFSFIVYENMNNEFNVNNAIDAYNSNKKDIYKINNYLKLFSDELDDKNNESNWKIEGQWHDDLNNIVEEYLK